MFVRLSSSRVPLSFSARKSGLFGAVGAVASMNTFMPALSVDVFPAESITE